ncbi:sporulation integral membrane protein YtvI [uncultured Blautia sp.]|uniref:AI-2E family transporter n=1 Tax=Blautia acetigignens TaxID=2981783 RepID=UPI000822FB2D|nr:AI-2E family transporter [Blautia acetigignens]MCU6773965.1 AI-2E family transporter [Blautia acetigignens]SCH22853.1 sporulation integral membrane protein YtvI [uncultured Blautia sp.]
MELNKENMRKIRWLIAFAVLLYLGIQNLAVVLKYVKLLWGLLLPFVLGGAMAFVLNVPMSFIERHLFGKVREKNNKAGKAASKLARPVSLVLSIVFVILLILIVVLVVAPELGTTLVSVVKKVEEDIPLAQKWITDTFNGDSEIVKWASAIEIDPQKILDSIVSVLKNGADNLVSSTITVTMGIVSMAVNFAIGFVFACYVLLQKEKLGKQVLKATYAILPVKVVEYQSHVCTLASKIFASFITGQCIEAVILGSMFFVTMTIGRFPYAMLIGVLISFTALIPVFGGIIGCWVGFFLILMVSPLKAFMFLGLFVILQQIEGNLIYPHVVGNSVGLPAIWVLMAVTLGGNLMGIVGMLIFIPLVSVLYTLFREWVYARLDKKKVKIS